MKLNESKWKLNGKIMKVNESKWKVNEKVMKLNEFVTLTLGYWVLPRPCCECR